MKKVVLALLLVISLNGCFICSGSDHTDLLVEHRKHLVEKVIPNYGAALEKSAKLEEAVDKDGKPVLGQDGEPLGTLKSYYIPEYKEENRGILVKMVEAIDRVLGDGPTEIPVAPWAKEEEEDSGDSQ